MVKEQPKVCVFDIEADGLLDTVTKIHCGVFMDLATQKVTKFTPTQMEAMLSFMDGCDVLIGHNVIGYDFPALKKVLGYEYQGKKVDTLVMSRLLYPKRMLPFHAKDKKAGPHSLYAWGVRVGVDKPEHHDWENYSEAMLHRCSEDVVINVKVYKELLKEAKGGVWRNAFLLTFRLFENLQLQEDYGWMVDRNHMERCVKQLDKWIERIDRVISPNLPNILVVDEDKIKGEYRYVKEPFLKSGQYSKKINEYCLNVGLDPGMRPIAGSFSRISFRKVDLNSNAETKDYLLKLGWEPLEWNTNDEGERTSPKMDKNDPFEGIDGKLGKLVVKRVQCRQRQSIIVGLMKLIRPDGSISSVVNNLTDTARATHRNIVNIPKAGSFYGKQMRQIFVARPGMVLVGTDSDSCQLRMLGARMGDPAYITALTTGDKAKGTDLHSLTKAISGVISRDIAKNVIYCLLFGGGDTKLGKTALMPGKGAELRAKLYKGFDGLEALVGRLTKEWRSTAKKRFNAKWNKMEYYNGSITGLDGRPIKVPYEHQLLVYLLQSDEAIMMSAAYNKAVKDLSKKYVYGKDFGFVAWYHDEFTVECRPEIAEDVKDISEKAIVWAGKFFNIQCPHVGDGKIGTDWYDIH